MSLLLILLQIKNTPFRREKIDCSVKADMIQKKPHLLRFGLSTVSQGKYIVLGSMDMSNITLLILGAEFILNSSHVQVMSYEQFCDLITCDADTFCSEKSRDHYHIYLGQGLSDETIRAITNKIACPSIAARYSLINMRHLNKRATALVNNTRSIISQPQQISEHVFHSALMLDESRGDAIGEVPRFNINAQILNNAAEQMAGYIATHVLSSQEQMHMKQFTLHQLGSRFAECILPLDVTLCFELNHLRHGLDGNFKAEATVQIMQNDKVVECIDLKFSVMDKALLLEAERYFADLALSEVFARIDCISNVSRAA